MYGLAAYVLWGLLTIYWKELSGLSAVELIGQRILWSALLLLAVLAVTRRWSVLDPFPRDAHLVGRIAVAAVLLAVNWTTYVWCVTHDNVVETALGYFIAPLGTVVIGVTVLREHLRRAQGVALGLAALAVVVLTLGYGRVPVFALILGATWACYGLLKRLVPLNALGSLTAETLLLLPAALVVVGAFEASGDGILRTGTTAQVALVALSGVVTATPLLLFAAAAKRVPFTTLGPLQYAVPTINLLLGVAVYHEPMPAWRLAGFALVWAGLAIFTVDSVRAARRSRAPHRPEPELSPVPLEG